MSGIVPYLAENPGILWGSIGVALLIVEVLAAHGFFLSYSLAAFALAAATGSNMLAVSPLWQTAIFAGLGIVLIFPIRHILRKYADKQPDINKY